MEAVKTITAIRSAPHYRTGGTGIDNRVGMLYRGPGHRPGPEEPIFAKKAAPGARPSIQPFFRITRCVARSPGTRSVTS